MRKTLLILGGIFVGLGVLFGASFGYVDYEHGDLKFVYHNTTMRHWAFVPYMVTDGCGAPTQLSGGFPCGSSSGASGGNSIMLTSTPTAGNNTGAAANTVATNAGQDVGTGNLLVVCVRNQGGLGVTATSVTDTGSTNTFTHITAGDGSIPAIGGDTLDAFFAKNTVQKAGDIFTAHFSGNASFTAILALQYAGASTSAPFDAAEGNFETANLQSSFTSGALNTAHANEVLVACFSEANTGATFTAGTGYTNEIQDPSPFTVMEDMKVTVIQSGVTASESSNLSNTWEAIIMGFTQ